MHVPLKATKSFKRRTTAPLISTNFSSSDTHSVALESPNSISCIPSTVTNTTPSSVRSNSKLTDSDTGGLSSLTLQEEDDIRNSTDSEFISSEPIIENDDDFSPDRKVQFTIGNYIEDIPENEGEALDIFHPSSLRGRKQKRG